MQQVHLDNLAKLRDFLLANMIPFHMADFRSNQDEAGEEFEHLTLDEYEKGEFVCGTAACAVGWAPFVIPPKPEHFNSTEEGAELKTWDYVHDTLIPGAYRQNRYDFDWPFGYGWAGVDNTREGAAYRINYLIENGAPPRAFLANNLEHIRARGYQRWVNNYLDDRDLWLKGRGINPPTTERYALETD